MSDRFANRQFTVTGRRNGKSYSEVVNAADMRDALDKVRYYSCKALYDALGTSDTNEIAWKIEEEFL